MLVFGGITAVHGTRPEEIRERYVSICFLEPMGRYGNKREVRSDQLVLTFALLSLLFQYTSNSNPPDPYSFQFFYSPSSLVENMC